MKQSSDVMFARLKNFKTDPEELRAHFIERIQKMPSTPYRDNRVDYVGWAVTSRDGTMEDGIRRIAPGGLSTRGVTPTAACGDGLMRVIETLTRGGLKPYRARIMQLESEGAEMPLHKDANTETWRLHIPIITNSNCFFEWQRADGSIESVHLPADGSAFLVRVDVNHRAVNRSNEASQRVHLLMGLGENPAFEMLAEPRLPVTLAGKPAVDLSLFTR
ncbi:aspartyl/asparaginyl beta-hydroxylase domain-containing protein [Paraburkholderia sp. HD33-4]|uniref:aspartyl/asparaginyl beta-hydroxylase domain-containing protein n=1 Tax=Paraburkholderia sp. HD33-4 TaxID=2883242 RepID=UPI001F25EF82|nr:aspartyl/asparaginyl beta-hydroxylase domain-containing protein [Paraburkholderia sp. HD33-4]